MAPYDITEEKEFPHSIGKVQQAVLGAVSGLEGKVLEQKEEGKQLKFFFPKTILGNTLGDRTHLLVELSSAGEGTKVSLLAYPVDAVERKLQFGARKGVTRTVVTWFWAHVEHRLK